MHAGGFPDGPFLAIEDDINGAVLVFFVLSYYMQA